MSRHASSTLIGAFVLGALGLVIATVLLLTGGQWFEKRGQHVLYFEGSAQGLQEGAPVVFLGVKIGTVKRIRLGLDGNNGKFLVSVTIEIEPQTIQSGSAHPVDLGDASEMRLLVEKGLRGQLRIQSLLTGQLYVDLDFHPEKPAQFLALDQNLSEIPTIPTTTTELANRFDRFPMERFLSDVAEISAGMKALLNARETQNLPARMESTLKQFESLAATLETRSGPVLDNLQTTLDALRGAIAATHSAMAKVEEASPKVGASADRVRGAADRVSQQFDPESPLITNLNQAAKDLADAASAIGNITTEESPTVQNLNRLLSELTRSARALRLLAETLEQQPEALLRGKH